MEDGERQAERTGADGGRERLRRGEGSVERGADGWRERVGGWREVLIEKAGADQGGGSRRRGQLRQGLRVVPPLPTSAYLLLLPLLLRTPLALYCTAAAFATT